MVDPKMTPEQHREVFPDNYEPEEPAVAEDDWELGPSCSTEFETCESCQ